MRAFMDALVLPAERQAMRGAVRMWSAVLLPVLAVWGVLVVLGAAGVVR